MFLLEYQSWQTKATLDTQKSITCCSIPFQPFWQQNGKSGSYSYLRFCKDADTTPFGGYTKGQRFGLGSMHVHFTCRHVLSSFLVTVAFEVLTKCLSILSSSGFQIGNTSTTCPVLPVLEKREVSLCVTTYCNLCARLKCGFDDINVYPGLHTGRAGSVIHPRRVDSVLELMC